MAKRFGVVLLLLMIVELGERTASAQSTTESTSPTTAPSTAAARLQLIADDQQTQITTRQAPAPPAPSPVPSLGAPSPTDLPARGPSTNDPTVPNAELRGLLQGDAAKSPTPTPSIPEIQLRARIVTPGKTPSALVEIGGGMVRGPVAAVGGPPAAPQRTYGVYRTIREGDEFVIPQGDATVPVRVVKLSAAEVVLELVNRNTFLRLD